MDLNGANMFSILSFDSHSLKYLMNPKFDQYFSKEQPLIYKNKISKNNTNHFYFRSALDNSLRYNQIRAAVLLIDYIRKYQNNYVSSYLFNKNLGVILEKGICITPLLNSKIFQYDFDF
jgi:hypothetical protein